MSATEQTRYPIQRLHRIFAVTSVVLLAATVWMFVDDHRRPWKHYQRRANEIDTRVTEWRKYQFETDEARRQRQRLEASLAEIRQQGLDPALLKEFRAELVREARRRGETFDANEFDRDCHVLEEALAAAQTAGRASADEGSLRDRLLQLVRNLVAAARFREATALRQQKAQSSDLDVAEAEVGLAVRNGRPAAEVARLQAAVERRKDAVEKQRGEYAARRDHRATLEDLVGRLTAKETDTVRAIADARSELDRLAATAVERRSEWVHFRYGFPLPGKKVLELPLLDAFNSPLRVHNLWAEGLTQDYNFREVLRFDRCTTCHTAIDKTLPGATAEGCYAQEQVVEFALLLASRENHPGPNRAGTEPHLNDRLEDLLGLRLAERGLLNPDDITVAYVAPGSAAAQAKIATPAPPLQTADEIFRDLLGPGESGPTARMKPGLLLGDALLAINGAPITSREDALQRLLVGWVSDPSPHTVSDPSPHTVSDPSPHTVSDPSRNLDPAQPAESTPQPILLTVRRGLPHPYASHPRLGLFVGESSPHKLADFACTICHEGQGSATDFTWASHAPNTEQDRKRWREQYGWFDNAHWPFPMFPRRFVESGCLKCHHRVVDLLPSERFPDPPAPKLLRGYALIRDYGCFGCHPISGFQGDERVSPDLRVEPDYHAVGFELAHHLPAETLRREPSKAETAEIRARRTDLQDVLRLAQQVGSKPDDTNARHELLRLLDQDAARAQHGGSALSSELLGLRAALKDVQHPGDLRRPGPSLRYLDHRVTSDFLYDWLNDPTRLRPTTRMPRFFGLWDHLDAASRRTAESFEPIEIHGLAAYLQHRTQDLPPTGADPDSRTRPDAPTGPPTADAERGRVLFQTRGCLACHDHKGFPDTAAFRGPDETVPGPDLSSVADKFTGEQGRVWLYSFIRQPMRHLPRTIMPDLFLTPTELAGGTGPITALTDPAADVVEYLWQNSKTGYAPPPAPAVDRRALDGVVMEHLRDVFHDAKARQYLQRGIPSRLSGNLQPAERELLVRNEDYDNPQFRLPDEQKLRYVGFRGIAKYGCFGCHDIPGFQNAKPIGVELTDWGRKDPTQLAFENIVPYLTWRQASSLPAPDKHADKLEACRHEPDYYARQLRAGHRIGFAFQKLTEPRSFDYQVAQNKTYNERLRMPQFPFDAEDREAILTFLLGLVADPPSAKEKYVYTPDRYREAIIEGQRTWERFNCGSCHLREPPRWQIGFPPATFRPSDALANYPFVRPPMRSEVLQRSRTADSRGLLQASLAGMPALNDDGQPLVFDDVGDELFEDEKYDPRTLEYTLQLWRPAALEGHAHHLGEPPLSVRGDLIEQRRGPDGGFLARYLLPHVVQLEKASNPNAKGSQAWGWLPPPLLGEGVKVQPDWLHHYLLDPTPIRPASFLRMPKFDLSADEARRLVDYFAARDNADYPYASADRRRRSYLQQAEQAYQQRLASTPDGPSATARSRFGDAMRIITDKNYCITCHTVGDFSPQTSDRAKGPNLAEVHKRLRSDYVQRWIANPASVLPYTGMPVIIPYRPEAQDIGGVDRSLYHGTSGQQLDAVVDLLMNFDGYSTQHSGIARMIEGSIRSPAAPPSGEN